LQFHDCANLVRACAMTCDDDLNVRLRGVRGQGGGAQRAKAFIARALAAAEKSDRLQLDPDIAAAALLSAASGPRASRPRG
jgi:hypothetical protein